MERRQRVFGKRNRFDRGGMIAAPRWFGPLAAALTVLTSHTAAPGDIPAAERRSGYEFMGRETRAMQDDDAANPGMLAVLDGETLWNRGEGPAGKSCASCHGDARQGMNGVAARYPAVDPVLGWPVDLEQRINLCRT
jgi:sulfur-oxidizing protein SoxA